MGSSYSVPMHVGLFNRPLVPHNLMSKSWDAGFFTKAPDRPQAWTSNILWVQKEKEPQVGVLVLRFLSLLHSSYIRDCRSAPQLVCMF